MKSIMKANTPKGTFSDEDLALYVETWSQKGALTSMLNYYRSIRTKIDYITQRVEGNVLIIWGENDRALKKELAELSLEFCANGKLEFVEAGHFVQHEASEIVNPLIIEHFKEEE